MRETKKATENNLLAFLDGTKQFIIPIYQRTYSWRTSDCQQLWDDVLRIAKDEQIGLSTDQPQGSIEVALEEEPAVPAPLLPEGCHRPVPPAEGTGSGQERKLVSNLFALSSLHLVDAGNTARLTRTPRPPG